MKKRKRCPWFILPIGLMVAVTTATTLICNVPITSVKHFIHDLILSTAHVAVTLSSYLQ